MWKMQIGIYKCRQAIWGGRAWGEELQYLMLRRLSNKKNHPDNNNMENFLQEYHRKTNDMQNCL